MRSAKPKKKPSLDATLRLIPGYDPFATAGPGEWFDEAAARRALEFFPTYLKHIEGKFAGDPFVLRSDQQAVIANLFGWKRADGTRRYRECLIGQTRGSGKTPIAAGIANYLFFADGEKGSVGFITATTVEQAALCFRHVHGQIVREPNMSGKCKVNVSQKSIISGSDRNAVMRVVSADGGALHGGTPHFWILDELHAWASGSREVYEAIQTSFAKSLRRQPLRVYITTRDFDRPSVCNDIWDRAEKIRDGVIKDSSFLPAIWAAADDDDWTSEAVWEKANPGIDVTVDRVALRQMCEEAQLSTQTENSFKRLHLNMKTGQDVRWLTLEDWDRCGAEFDADSLRGRTCYAAIDLAAVKDTCALALVFPHGDGGFDLLTYFWLPEKRARKAVAGNEGDYLQWAADGYIKLTPGDAVDHALIRSWLKDLGTKFQFRTIGIDPWQANSESILRIRDDGFQVYECAPNFAFLSEPSKHFERMLIAGKVRHNRNKVMRWMVSNVSATTDGAENIKPSKKKSTGRIDGVVATVMAIGMMKAEPQGSVYDDVAARPEGLLSL